ncbi:hypothetical protein S7711_04137 [Stachybotrys chartarum IBT 7711]|uniref:chitinase n=1 Tax=Stachybotrys chartarum (strain CBS 109288 / IBT 7711) TaxID=1280523 RepID=A0A084B6J2_STACB|nr:hypothetical protein S7711_04137 [Stachybotrys chartarum IBT 7711]KFA54472.1 hypothetical protein S40293_08000 [Stachybotrys chartarum IBT 40293]
MLFLSNSFIHHVVFLAVLLPPFLDTGAFVEAQVSTVNGQAVYQATPVQQNPHGIPTLVYNCAKLPALCQNVHQRNPLQAVTQAPPRPNGLGALQGVTHILLHFDRAGNAGLRRGTACPSGSWRRTHTCPETNQPHTVPRGSMLGSGSYPAARYNPNNIAAGQPGYNVIANSQQQHSGMMWTCDEFPPASSVEGGAGANTFCAPANARCGGGPNAPPVGGGVDSEQNFQGAAHTTLRSAVFPGSATGVFRFHFRTRFNTDIDGAPTEVHWYGPGSEHVTITRRYSNGAPRIHHFVQYFYDNGTNLVMEEPIDEEEYLLLRRNWYSDLDGNSTLIDESSLDILPDVGQLASRQSTDDIWLAATGTGTNPARQGYEVLPESPPLPFIEIARDFIADQEDVEHDPYIARVLDATEDDNEDNSRRSVDGEISQSPSVSPRSDGEDSGWMWRRQSQRQCDSVTPCPDGSCCNRAGRCGFGNETCGSNVCISNCDATAFCGRESADGETVCPLNVCCSYYGYCGVEDDFCLGAGPDAPCQQGFGSCNTISPPSCGGNSAFARTIGYYQLANVRERQCNRIAPSEIRTEGLTHLYAAFATINPSTFAVEPWHSDDVQLYEELAALRSSTLQVWIAIGGWTFNDPGPTRTTFSDLAMNPTRRRRFINSLVSFLERHGFQGVDLDWEYPGAPDRGGRPEDTENYVALVREMREVFGTRFGISMAIPTSYWYLRWFRPKDMEPYVDYFGVMSYDLHGPWDEDVRQIGRVVLGHTNIPEIANWTLPLYYEEMDPAKLNMGLAYYARGYTVATSDCNAVGCDWVSTSRPAPCTNFGGVMSLEEIERMIDEQGMTPRLLTGDMMMQLTFGNQWIGYDNLDTIQMKKRWASRRCFGGTMIWSVDMYSGSGSGDIPDGGGSENPDDPGGGQGEGSGMVYIDPEIWEEDSPEVNCWPPCTLVMPPLSLETPITISLPPYETSLDVAWSGSDGWHSTIQTTTLTIPVMTITTVEVWHITVRETRTATESRSNVWATYFITPSIYPPTFVITNDLPETTNDGVTRPPGTRTITPPPWPWTFTPPDPEATTTRSNTPDEDLPEFPVVTWRPGDPGPRCRSGCGRPCRIFCSFPCLLNCPDPGIDFPDPSNPRPPTRPVPQPTGPGPTIRPTPGPSPPPSGSEPENEEHEELEQQCAAEFGHPLPTFRPSDSSTTVIPSPTRPPPSPSPTPDPEPPSPNPDTEEVDCYNSGQFIRRDLAIEALDYFCDRFEGQVLDANRPETERTLQCQHGVHCFFAGCFVNVVMSVTVKNGCRFTMGGNGAREECGRIIRSIIDECDTSSTERKQGGRVSSNCADWRFDPNNNWGDNGIDFCS